MSTGSAVAPSGAVAEREMHADGRRDLAGRHCRDHLLGERRRLGSCAWLDAVALAMPVLGRGVAATRKRSEQARRERKDATLIMELGLHQGTSACTY